MGGLGLCVVLDGPLGGGFALGRFDRTYVCQHYPRSWTLFQRVVTIGCQLSAKALVPGCAWSEHSPKGWAPPRPKPTRLGPVIPRTEALACVVKSPGSVGRDISRRLLPLHTAHPLLPTLSIQKQKHQHQSSVQVANDPIPTPGIATVSYYPPPSIVSHPLLLDPPSTFPVSDTSHSLLERTHRSTY